MKPLVILVGGPTGIGKTTTAIKLAQLLNTEIISADSRQIYKEMTIGTAVPEKEELAAIKHHFIQNKSIHNYYNASMYEEEVLPLIENLHKKQNSLVLVGGSGLYIDSVIKGIDYLPTIPPEIRKKYADLYELEGLKKIQELVKTTDPTYYEKVDINNHKRMLKALEVYDITQKPYSSFLKNKAKDRPFNVIKIFLDTERSVLYDQINKRVNLMIDKGLISEALSLKEYSSLQALNTVGYKELFSAFRGEISEEEAITQIKNHSRAYARRQLTWFRRYDNANWFSPNQVNDMVNLINKEL